MEKLKRNSYVMYYNVSDAALDLSDKEYKEFGELIHNYVFYGIEPETDNLAIKMLLKVYRPALDESLATYDKRASGNGGGRKKNHKEPQETTTNHQKPSETTGKDMETTGNHIEPSETTSNPNNNVNYNVNENKNVNVNEIDITTRDTINNPDNFDQSKEVNKQNVVIEEKEDIKETNVNKKDITPVVMKEKTAPFIKSFEEGIGKGLVPTVEQITGFVIKNKIEFDKQDFQLNVLDNPVKKELGVVYTEMINLGRSAMNKLIPMKEEYGYVLSSDTQTVQEFMKRYVESDRHQDLKIKVINR